MGLKLSVIQMINIVISETEIDYVLSWYKTTGLQYVYQKKLMKLTARQKSLRLAEKP